MQEIFFDGTAADSSNIVSMWDNSGTRPFVIHVTGDAECVSGIRGTHVCIAVA